MAKRNNIPLPTVKTTTQIPQIQAGDFFDVFAVFSYKYYDSEHKEFSAKQIETDELCEMLDRLKDYSGKKWKEMKNDKVHRFHSINWIDTNADYTEGFCRLPKVLRDVTAYQFKVGKLFRIFGFFYDRVFQIVWFDTKHKVYSED